MVLQVVTNCKRDDCSCKKGFALGDRPLVFWNSWNIVEKQSELTDFLSPHCRRRGIPLPASTVEGMTHRCVVHEPVKEFKEFLDKFNEYMHVIA